MIDSLNLRAARALGTAGIAALGIALVAAVPASARRTASSSQVSALTRAVHGSPVAGLNRIPKSHYRVTNLRVSTVSKSWASASVTPTARYRTSLQGISVVAVQPAGTRTWVVVDAGSAEVGCGFAPTQVLADLYGGKASTVCAAG
jgi:hypothetical protein